MKKIINTFFIALVVTLTSCVQEEHEKTITFSVDMNGIENLENVGIRGDFTEQSWRETIPMTDENGDGIYEFSVSRKTAVYGIEFKFVKNNTEFELQDKPNRELVFEYKPEIIEYKAVFNNNQDTNIIRK